MPILSLRSFGTKITLVLIFSMLFSASLSNFLISEYALQQQFSRLRENLITLAKIAALMVDADTITKVPLNKEGVNAPEYKSIAKTLSTIKEATPHITYIYTLAKTDREGIFKFIVDPNPIVKNAKNTATSFPGELYDGSKLPELTKALTTPSADKKIDADEWGMVLSGYAPIRDHAGKTVAVLGVDIMANDIHALQKELQKRAFFVLFLGVVLFVILGIIISRRITNPIKRLIAGTRHFAKGELSYKVSAEGDDEIAELSRSFNSMSSDLMRHIEELEKTTTEKERLLKELEIAKGIQQSFLPDSVPEMDGFEFAAASFPARVVGGDFYDFIPIEKGRWGIAVADVSGKGIPAALFMALSRTLIRATATGKPHVAEALETANRLIMEGSKTSLFVTVFYGILDSKNMGFKYTNAGHNPPLLVHGETADIMLLEAKGIPLGLMPEIKAVAEEITLKKGDVIALYTDGVTEALNDNKEQFEITRLSKVISENRSKTAQQILDKVREDLKAFVGNQPQFDDITLMIIKAV